MTTHRILRQAGLRATLQRQVILEAIEDLDHATPAQIMARVQATIPCTNLSTIYRTLDVLEKAGIITQAVLTEHVPMFFLHVDEVHMVCDVCQSIACVHRSSIEKLALHVKAAYGFDVDPGHLVLRGACVRCQRAGHAATPTPQRERLAA